MIRSKTLGAALNQSGTATSEQPICGEILSIHLDFTGADSGTDVTVATVTAPVRTILTTTDVNADGWYNPRHIVHTEAGAAVTYDGTNEVYAPVPVSDYIKVTVAQGDSSQSVVATIVWKE